MDPQSRPVPWRTILAVAAAVVGTYVLYVGVRELHKILTWLLVAGFIAVVLNPAVDFLQRRARMRRGLATMVVFLAGIGLFSAMLYAFIRPIVDQSQEFADNFPAFVEDAKEGRGPVGRLVQRYDVDEWIERNQDTLREAASDAGQLALRNAPRAASFVVALLTILVLAFLMLMQGPSILSGVQNALSPRWRDRVRAVANDAARAVSGYMFGNFLISVIAGVAVFVFLSIAGVPFQGVQALWVAFADLIPLVGATLGAVPVIAVSFLHSVPAGVAAIVFFIVYQQFENHVLQVGIMSRTVDLNPLVVLVSVLIGVELMGFVGALLAIPAGGVAQVVVRDIWDERRGRLKEEPTVGEDETPVPALVEPGPGAVDGH